MRWKAYPPQPCRYQRLMIYVHPTDGVYLFLSTSREDDVHAEAHDNWFLTVEDAQVGAEYYGVGAEDWIEIPDPQPHAQDDMETPIFAVRDSNGRVLEWLDYAEAHRRGMV